MPIRIPDGAITNFGAVPPNTPIVKKDGYYVIGEARKKPLGAFIAESIIQDAELFYFGTVFEGTRLGMRLAKLERRIATASKNTTKSTFRSLKKTKSKYLPSRKDIYKQHGYTELEGEKSVLDKLEHFAEKNEEFRKVVYRIYKSVKAGAKTALKEQRHDYKDIDNDDGFHVTKVDYDGNSKLYTFYYTQEIENEDFGSFFDEQRRITQETLAKAEKERKKNFVKPVYDPKADARLNETITTNIRSAELLSKFTNLTGYNISVSNGKASFTPSFEKTKDYTDSQLNRIWKDIEEDKPTTTPTKNSNFVYPNKDDVKPKGKVLVQKLPITSNTPITHMANNTYDNVPQQHDTHTPIINNDWRSINEQFVDKIDSDTIADNVENN